MNLNELNVVKSINIEAPIAEVKAGTGTFKDILDKVYCGDIVPLTNNNGDIVGMSYDAHAENRIEDNIAEMKFQKQYAGLPVMEWVLAALRLKAGRAVIDEVIENGLDVKVVTYNGEEIIITEAPKYNDYNSYEEELPDNIELSFEELNIDINDDWSVDEIEEEVKDYLRNEYDHYLAKGNKLDIIVDYDDEYVTVNNIVWGRSRDKKAKR